MSCTAYATIAALFLALDSVGLVPTGGQRPSWLESEQTLTIQYGAWKPGPETLKVTDLPRGSLFVEDDRVLLSQWSRTGRLNIVGGHASRITPAPSVRPPLSFQDGR